MLRFHKFTIGHLWRKEYGDPDIAEEYQWLRRYSPLHNIPDLSAPHKMPSKSASIWAPIDAYQKNYSVLQSQAQSSSTIQYPATLVITADHDDRVSPLHSYKFVAEMQYKLGGLAQQSNPLFLLIESDAGHGSGKPIRKIVCILIKCSRRIGITDY